MTSYRALPTAERATFEGQLLLTAAVWLGRSAITLLVATASVIVWHLVAGPAPSWAATAGIVCLVAAIAAGVAMHLAGDAGAFRVRFKMSPREFDRARDAT